MKKQPASAGFRKLLKHCEAGIVASFDLKRWTRTEEHFRQLPGGPTFCERIRTGGKPWPAIGYAITLCSGFPANEFRAIASTSDFDVRWPLSFAAWFWGASGASVDKACAQFLSEAGLCEKARAVLPEYSSGPDWLPEWRNRFMKVLEQHPKAR